MEKAIDYKKEILEMLEIISDEWVLCRIYRCIKMLVK